MASQPDISEISSTLERLVRNRELSLFLPFIFGFSNNLQRRDLGQDQDQDQDQNQSNDHQNNNNNNTNRVILINPFTQGMVVIEGSSSLDSLLRELSNGKDGQPPASKSAIEAMPRVEISEDCGGGEECVICLEEFCVGGFAKEMPCNHRFHENCIEKWLGIHGSCPVCRHKMPVDEEESESKRRVFEREIWVSFSFNNNNNNGNRRSADEEESNQNGSANDGGDGVEG